MAATQKLMLSYSIFISDWSCLWSVSKKTLL